MAAELAAGAPVNSEVERAQEQRGFTVRTQSGWLSRAGIGGIAGKLIARLRSTKTSAPKLALVERIALGPRQSLALVEAEGRRFLVATSAEGGPAFLAIGGGGMAVGTRSARRPARGPARVSW